MHLKCPSFLALLKVCLAHCRREAAEWAAKIDLLLLLVSNKNENENEQLSAAAKIRLLLDSFSKDLEKKSHQLDDHYMRMAIFETNLSNLSYRLEM